MASQPHGTRVHVDADGVRVERPSAARTVIRVTLVAMGVVVLASIGSLIALRMSPGNRIAREAPTPSDVVPRGRPSESPPGTPAAADVPAPPVVPAASHPVPPSTATPAHGVRRAPAAVPEPPEKEDEPFTIGDPKERTGMRVFPPPGTKPIKRGIVVPDDFELPPGFVRHYQATDDGQRLPAILMFSPDYDWVDAQGNPLALPADRVVPPELAPPGMPIKMLDVPEAKTAADPTP